MPRAEEMGLSSCLRHARSAQSCSQALLGAIHVGAISRGTLAQILFCDAPYPFHPGLTAPSGRAMLGLADEAVSSRDRTIRGPTGRTA